MRKCQGKCGVTIPVSESEGTKDFCEYMGYTFIKQVGDTCYYKLPPGHACRLLINQERWEQGVFDKGNFLESLKN